MARHRWGIMPVFVVLGLLFSSGDSAAGQQKLRLNVLGIT